MNVAEFVERRMALRAKFQKSHSCSSPVWDCFALLQAALALGGLRAVEETAAWFSLSRLVLDCRVHGLRDFLLGHFGSATLQLQSCWAGLPPAYMLHVKNWASLCVLLPAEYDFVNSMRMPLDEYCSLKAIVKAGLIPSLAKFPSLKRRLVPLARFLVTSLILQPQNFTAEELKLLQLWFQDKILVVGSSFGSLALAKRLLSVGCTVHLVTSPQSGGCVVLNRLPKQKKVLDLFRDDQVWAQKLTPKYFSERYGRRKIHEDQIVKGAQRIREVLEEELEDESFLLALGSGPGYDSSLSLLEDYIEFALEVKESLTVRQARQINLDRLVFELYRDQCLLQCNSKNCIKRLSQSQRFKSVAGVKDLLIEQEGSGFSFRNQTFSTCVVFEQDLNHAEGGVAQYVYQSAYQQDQEERGFEMCLVPLPNTKTVVQAITMSDKIMFLVEHQLQIKQISYLAAIFQLQGQITQRMLAKFQSPSHSLVQTCPNYFVSRLPAKTTFESFSQAIKLPFSEIISKLFFKASKTQAQIKRFQTYALSSFGIDQNLTLYRLEQLLQKRPEQEQRKGQVLCWGGPAVNSSGQVQVWNGYTVVRKGIRFYPNRFKTYYLQLILFVKQLDRTFYVLLSREASGQILFSSDLHMFNSGLEMLFKIDPMQDLSHIQCECLFPHFLVHKVKGYILQTLQQSALVQVSLFWQTLDNMRSLGPSHHPSESATSHSEMLTLVQAQVTSILRQGFKCNSTIDVFDFFFGLYQPQFTVAAGLLRQGVSPDLEGAWLERLCLAQHLTYGAQFQVKRQKDLDWVVHLSRQFYDSNRFFNLKKCKVIVREEGGRLEFSTLDGLVTGKRKILDSLFQGLCSKYPLQFLKKEMMRMARQFVKGVNDLPRSAKTLARVWSPFGRDRTKASFREGGCHIIPLQAKR